MLRPTHLAPYEAFELEQITDSPGTMYLGHLMERVAEPIDRFFFLTGVPAGQQRGGHAHKEQAEYLICVRGSLEVRIESCGAVDIVPLKGPGSALFVPGGYWRDLTNFSDDAVLAVFATQPYREADYIRDLEAFRRWESGRES